MRCCKSPATDSSRTALAALLFACAALTACSGEPGSHGFRIVDADLSQSPRRLDVRLAQEMRLSAEAIEALQHGVPLTLGLDLELRDSASLTLLATDRREYEIRYLPLSEHYQLTLPDRIETRTYPRLRHALSDLSVINLQFATGPLAPGEYEFRARIRLRHSNLPAPMQLPALLSDAWRHDSRWSQWPFEVSA